jgi:predicted alpha/beta superfamily hydrolase
MMNVHSRIETITSFHSVCLNNDRDVFVYLPPGYDQEPEASYPVMYVHDGQNVFAKAFNGQTWNLHVICDQLISERRIEKLVVVAVSNMGIARNSEFAHSGPFAAELDYPCCGELYERFLVEELKPYIDRTYRTKRESRHTALMGSSRGGLVTYHIGFRRPDVFGMLAMLSPYFAQYDEEKMQHSPIALRFEKKQPLKLWIDVGGMEGMTVLAAHVRSMAEHFIQLGYRSGDDLHFCYEPTAEHNEAAWESRVHGPLIGFFGDKGAPAAVQLIGDELAALSGAKSCLYPIVQYESGLNIVDLHAAFSVIPREGVRITSQGTILAAKTGRYHVEYRRFGLKSEHLLAVIDDLPPQVTVELKVVVPADTPHGAKIHAGVELQRTGRQIYRRRFSLPRGTGYSFRICDYSGLQETDAGGAELPKRRFIANENLKIRYEVKGWVQGNTL